MNASLPTLAAVIVNWNRRKDLHHLLQDLRRQTDPAEELIVVDNGSTDGSPEMVEEYFPEARLVRLPRNKGVSFGRNMGIEVSRSELLMFPDNDLRILDRSFLRRARSSALAHPDCGIIGFQVIVAEKHCKPGSKRTRLSLQDQPKFRLDPIGRHSYYTSTFPGGASIVRRETFNKVGVFDPALWYGGEESDFGYRCHKAEVRLVRDTELIVVHLRSDEMRPWYHEGLAWRNELIALRRWLPFPDLIVAEAFKVAQTLVAGGGARKTLYRVLSFGSELLFRSNGNSGVNCSPCSRSTMSLLYFLDLFHPQDFSDAQRAELGPLRYWFKRTGIWLQKKAKREISQCPGRPPKEMSLNCDEVEGTP